MVHFFDSHIAQKYGVNAAVLAGFLWDCAEEKSTQSPQLHEGRVWVRCSVQMMTGFFPFLSYDEIRYALKRLIKEQISALSKELAALRREAVLCDGIAERSGVIKEKIKAVRKDNQPERKEKTDHVQFR